GRWRPYRWRPALVTGQDEPGRRVMSPLAAALVLDVLSDPVARLPGFGLETPFDFPFPAAVKTGTSRHFTDNWAVGVTGGFTVAVWVGNFNGRPMDGVSGVSGAGPLLRRAMLATAERYAPGVLPAPREQGAVPVTICRVSGMLAGEHCPTMTEWVQPGLAPSRRCDWHGPDGLRLPAEYAEWASAAAGPAAPPVVQLAAAAAPFDSAGRFRIVAPRDGDRYEVPPGVDRRYATLALRAGGAGAGNVRWYVDGHRVRGDRWPLTPGAHRVRAEGSGGAHDEVRIEVQ
ncbi:MAG TPA: hypothetical protein VFS11_07590, partial [Gemmatimonadales bacterium]|nr:hypothetical protein [Gemmatimonadales bacterium]